MTGDLASALVQNAAHSLGGITLAVDMLHAALEQLKQPTTPAEAAGHARFFLGHAADIRGRLETAERAVYAAMQVDAADLVDRLKQAASDAR